MVIVHPTMKVIGIDGILKRHYSAIKDNNKKLAMEDKPSGREYLYLKNYFLISFSILFKWTY